MFCTECGKDNQDTNKFCYNCGSKLISKQTQASSSKEGSSNTNPDKTPLDINYALYNNDIKIKEGDNIYTSKAWKLSDDLLSLKTTISLTAPFLSIPIEEITSLTKCDTANQIIVSLSDGKELLIEMDELAFNALHESFKNDGNKPNGVSLPVEVKGEKKVIYQKALAVFAVSAIVVILGYGGQSEPSSRSESSSSGKNKPTSEYVSKDVQVTPTQADAVIKLIRVYGYSCSTLSSALQSSYDGSFSVTCNNWKYRYDIEDIGGNWVVTVD